MKRVLRLLRALELEEKILHLGAVLCLLSLFFPWLGGQWFGVTEQWNGFGFHTGFIGHFVFLMMCVILGITLSPLLGGPLLVKKSRRNVVRLLFGCISTALLIAAFTVLFRLTAEVSGAEVRFGVYLSILSSALVTLYAYLQYQDEIKKQSQSVFHHPDALPVVEQRAEKPEPPRKPSPPPPPPPPEAENHSLFPPQ